MTKTFKASEEFVVGKHGIGYVYSDFLSNFSSVQFKEKSMPTFQKLPHSMNDAEIENELKPGLCELGDVIAFMDNTPKECKDGNWNLFYTASHVVHVRWGGDAWHVRAWARDDSPWSADYRVFSPATSSETLNTGPSESLSLDTLEKRIKILEDLHCICNACPIHNHE